MRFLRSARLVLYLGLGALVVAGTTRSADPGGSRSALPDPDERWIRVETEHFTLVGNAGPRATIGVARNLERLDEALGSTSRGLKLRSPQSTTVYVFKDEHSFLPYNLDVHGKPRQISGYFHAGPAGNCLAIDASSGESPFPVVYHEYLHYVMHNTIPALPVWLDEGLAEVYSTFRIAGQTAELGLPIARHLEWLATHSPLPLTRLIAVDHGSPEYNESERRGTFYAQSWALAHYLLLGDPERRERMNTLLERLAAGSPSRDALEAALSAELPAIEERLAAHIKAEEFRFVRYTPQQPFDEARIVVQPLRYPEVLVYLGELLAYRPGQRLSADRHLSAALELDPALAVAHVAQARLALRDGRAGEAIDLAAKATALDPRNAAGQAVLGASLFAAFLGSGSAHFGEAQTTPPPLLRAREAYRRSLEAHGTDVERLIGFGRTFLFDHAGGEEGRAALARAAADVPTRTDVLRDLVVLTALTGNLDGARVLLEGSLRPHGQLTEVRTAERALADRVAERARELADAGRPEEARAVISALAEALRDSGARRTLEQARVALDPPDPRTLAATPDTPFDAAEEIRRLEALAGDETAPQELREAAASQLGEMRRSTDFERLHQAVLLADGGDVRAAIAAVEALLESELAPDVRRRAEQTLRMLREPD